VRHGAIVNRTWGETYGQLRERHSAEDIDRAIAASTAESQNA